MSDTSATLSKIGQEYYDQILAIKNHRLVMVNGKKYIEDIGGTLQPFDRKNYWDYVWFYNDLINYERYGIYGKYYYDPNGSANVSIIKSENDTKQYNQETLYSSAGKLFNNSKDIIIDIYNQHKFDLLNNKIKELEKKIEKLEEKLA